MKITGALVRLFENDQATYGTKTAMHNLLYLNAVEQFEDLGIKKVKTEEKPARKKKKRV